VLEPWALTYVPDVHGDHAVHTEAFAVVENVPPPQAVQPRSVVALPAVDTYSPGKHPVHEVHVVLAF
jgi:hypothetical protein